MKKLTEEIWIVAAKRTPFGAMGGAFKGLSATELGVHAAKAALAQSGLEPSEIDHVVFGNVQQTSADAIYCARHVGLKSGLPIETPAMSEPISTSMFCSTNTTPRMTVTTLSDLRMSGTS